MGKNRVIKVIRLKGCEWKGVDEIRREGGRHEERRGWAGLQTWCSQAHTSSLRNDLLSVGILFRSNRLLQQQKERTQFDFSFVDYLWHRWRSEIVWNAAPLGNTFFKNTVRAHAPSRCHGFSEHPNKLLVRNIAGGGRWVARRNAELCTVDQLLFKSMQTAPDDAWNHFQRCTDAPDRAFLVEYKLFLPT